MQLERITIALRPRQGWEAVDLGFRMAARWARPLWATWFAVYVPFALALSFALREWPWAAALALWWLKPLFDRCLLHVLSRAVFGHVPRLSQTLGAWREILSPAFVWSLVARCWDYARSFTLPVWQLERQHGAAARARRKLLKQRVGAHALGLTFVCSLFEAITLYGFYAIGTLFETDVQWRHDTSRSAVEMLGDVASWWSWHDTALYALAVSLIEPFYVAGGFALYLNRRVLLEGWDVEMALRRLAQRLAPKLATVALVLALILGGLAAPPARAQDGGVRSVAAVADDSTDEDDEASGDDEEDDTKPAKTAKQKADEDTRMCPAPYVPRDTEAHRKVGEVLADPMFGSERKQLRWEAIEKAPRESKPRERSGVGGKIAGVIAEVLRVAAWIAIAALVIAVIWLVARRWQGRDTQAANEAPPTQLFGLAIHPDSLPPDIPAAARAALAQGHVREALSLLYRGALSHLVHVRGLSIRRGATEGDVLRLARRTLPTQPVAYFEELLPAWVEAAYAARIPDAERVAALCAQHAQAMPRETAGDVVGARA